jgi:formylglycine-generating enzyme
VPDATRALLSRLSGVGGGTTTAEVAVPGQASIEWVSLGSFEMSKTEVTVAQYRACVQTGTCTEPDTKQGCNWGQSGRDDHPINCVDWRQATTFAHWAGGRLPTGEEWSHAATSGDASRDYPWGNEKATCERAIMRNRGCGLDSTWPVCSKPAGNSRQDVCDLSGNVWEWTQESSGSHRVIRGGGLYDFASSLRVSHKSVKTITGGSDYLGFRLVK